jgi:hypothetical protein
VQEAAAMHQSAEGAAPLSLPVEDFEKVARACPKSIGILREALDQQSALAYFPEAPSGSRPVLCAVALCALEASGNWRPP